MKKSLLSLSLAMLSTMAWALPNVEIMTNHGAIVVELDAEKAPKTVENFVQYAKEGFYNGTIFHRVIRGFMIQGGGFTPDLTQKKTRDAIGIESANGLKNLRGTIAMARTSDPNSATSQFFINLVDNQRLDYTSSTLNGYGYAVFGKVISGMDVVDKIAEQKTTYKGQYQDVPSENVVIQKVTVTNADEMKAKK